MKALGVVVPKRDKHEFCFMYRELFDQLIGYKGWNEFRALPVIKEIATHARRWFHYADTYNSEDMVWSLYKFNQRELS